MSTILIQNQSKSDANVVGPSKSDAVGQDELCSVCCELYTSTRRKKVTCFHCNQSACVSCIKRYLLSTYQDPHCLHCRFHWNREFIDQILSQNFMSKEYKEHRENVLCEREKSKIPETQAICMTVKSRKESIESAQKKFQQELEQIQEEMEKRRKEYYEKMRQLKIDLDQCEVKIRRLMNVEMGITDTIPQDEDFIAETKERAKNIMYPCPQESCNAYLDEKLRCGQCNIKLCKTCHAVLPDVDNVQQKQQSQQPQLQHVCNENDVASVKQLKKDSKNCPGCSALIYKIDGCDQMWCTQCHTAFSWRTGEKIDSGQIHNPHFYEWKRQNGGLAPGAVDADGCPLHLHTMLNISNVITNLTGKTPATVIWELHREITEIEALHLNIRRMEYVDPNRYLRVRYLKGHIKEETWKAELQRIEKKEMKTFEVRQVYHMYVATMKDLFRMITTAKTCDELQQLQDDMVSLLEYVYSNLCKINSRYASTAIPVYAKDADRVRVLGTFCLNNHVRF
jgi:ribosomal protein S21